MASPVNPTDGIVWITGASSGIGREIALLLARLGWRVAATARRADELEALSGKIQSDRGEIRPYPADISDAAKVAEVAHAIETEFGPIACLIANAGIYLPVDARAFDLSSFAKTIDVNIKGTANCLAPVIAAMTARKRGQIVIVASVTGYGGLPTSGAYGASKAALINLAETLRIELDALNILVQVVNPGFVDTPATANNPFPMPALMSVANAARTVVRGLSTQAFEITFPRRFTYVLKGLGLIPVRWRLALVRRFTGWDDPAKRPPIPGDQNSG